MARGQQAVDTNKMSFSQEAQNEEFMKVVDELVVNAQGDSELADGLKWIDMQSREKGISFYEMAFIVLKKHTAERRAREWLKAKNSAAGSNNNTGGRNN
jgi:hypothetical protein